MRLTQLKECTDLIIAHVKENGPTTFLELHKLLDELGVETHGDLSFSVPGYPTVVLWEGLSPDFVGIIRSVQLSRLVNIEGCDPLIYSHDGTPPDLPIANELFYYKTPHWAPVVFVAAK